VFLICSCNTKSGDTEKYQNRRDSYVNVHDKVKEIIIDDVLIGGNNMLCLLNHYLLIGDLEAHNEMIHIFNSDTYQYLGSTAPLGQGPHEVTLLVHIAPNNRDGKFYVTDNGKNIIFSYDIDSVLHTNNYVPVIKTRLTAHLIPVKYQYFSDTLSIGGVYNITSPTTFDEVTSKWNMMTGSIEPMPYKHPSIKRSRIEFAASSKYNIYVEGHCYNDLLTICSLDGNLKYNIYGPKWNSKMSNEKAYIMGTLFCKDKILALYSNGKEYFQPNWRPTQILVFDLSGDYLKTLDVGYQIQDFRYDENNNRLILSLDDEIQFAYLPLDDIL
jgi:hypothetical protein